jgi:hypothetical protein
VVVDRDLADDPLVGGVGATECVALSGTADALDGGVEPQRHEDLGIDRGSAGPALDGLDAVVHGAEVEAFDVVPDEARGMIVGDQIIQWRRSEDDLIAVGGAEPGPSLHWGGGLGLGWRIVADLEQGGLVGLGLLALQWSAPRDIITMDSALDDHIRPDSGFFHRL